jgi:transcriptional antiterminator RfaH
MTSRNGDNGSNGSKKRDSLIPDPRPLTSDMRWYVVQSKPREEERALHFLKEKGFHTYLPRMEVVKIRGFKNVKTEKPLFPGYLFCRFSKSDESLAHVRWTQGVKKMLPESVDPMPVDDEIVAAIHKLEQKDGVIRKKPLQKSDRIRITRGPMKDILGIFDYWTSDEGRVMVLLNFINYQASVELHHSLIEKVA